MPPVSASHAIVLYQPIIYLRTSRAPVSPDQESRWLKEEISDQISDEKYDISQMMYFMDYLYVSL